MAERRKTIKLWLQEEDEVLVTLIEKHGYKNWKSIANELKKKFKIVRSAKQCRDRWFNNLKTASNEVPFSEQEVQTLLELFSRFGSQWSKISQQIPNRTENQMKNFMNAMVRRNIRKYNKGKLEREKIKINSLEILHIPEVKELLCARKEVNRKWFADKFLSDQALMAIECIRFSQNFNENMIMMNYPLFPVPGFDPFGLYNLK